MAYTTAGTTVQVLINNSRSEQGWTGPLACLVLARWAGWSAGRVGCHVKFCRNEWNGGGVPEALR